MCLAGSSGGVVGLGIACINQAVVMFEMDSDRKAEVVCNGWVCSEIDVSDRFHRVCHSLLLTPSSTLPESGFDRLLGRNLFLTVLSLYPAVN